MRQPQQGRTTPPSWKGAHHDPAKKLEQGIATEMWLELVPYSELPKEESPDAHIRSLWLLVNGVWLSYDLEPRPESKNGSNTDDKSTGDRSNTDGTPETKSEHTYDHIERAVLSAFSEGFDRLQVHVWYYVDPPTSYYTPGATDPDPQNAYGTYIVGLVVHSK